MSRRVVLAVFALLLFGGLVWLFVALGKWAEEADTGPKVVFRSKTFDVVQMPGTPAAYVVVKDGKRLLIDCPEHVSPEQVTRADMVLLTHNHRDTVGGAGAFVAAGVPVRASKESAKWLNPPEVAKHWQAQLPLRNSNTGYFVHPTGIAGIDCTLADGQTIEWQGLKIEVIGTPGHSSDHLAFAVDGVAFVGDMLTADGKLWTPFTTDWDHWQDGGLKAQAASVAKVEGRGFTKAFSARALTPVSRETKASVPLIEEAGFLKSFERYTNRVGDPPKYDFLVPKEQVGSNGSKPWSQVSPSLWITGNTYVLKSKDDGALMVLDPWGDKMADRIDTLRKDEKLGAVELAMFSHAHFDHFDGLFPLPEKGKCDVWALETVAEPIREPFKLRQPFLDERPIAFTRTFKEGETATWREYTFKFHHLPGQTWYTSAIEATIDGKRCLFTADNFFHFTQYSGSGGWMGLNRSHPSMYAASAKKVLGIAPERVLAEHGGPYTFDAEDYRRRAGWGEAAAKACDAISPSGSSRRDWNPHAVSVSPIRIEAKAGDTIKFSVRVEANTGGVKVRFAGRGVLPDQELKFDNSAQPQMREITLTLPAEVAKGRQVFAVCPTAGAGEFADPFVVVEVR